jgi:hypothetical protein
VPCAARSIIRIPPGATRTVSFAANWSACLLSMLEANSQSGRRLSLSQITEGLKLPSIVAGLDSIGYSSYDKTNINGLMDHHEWLTMHAPTAFLI